MLVLNFMYMKKNLFRFSSRRFLFSTVMAFALVTGAPQAVFANVGEVQAVSQTGVIKGKIVDSYGEPVIGANVKVKGTTNGTITDMDGNFTLNNVSGGTLVISFIGYKTLEVSVKGTNLAKIIMHEDTEVLDEVVVVGYGTQKKESLTGSVTVVDQKLFKDKGTVANPLSAMQGQVPGLRITRSSAAPGEEGWGVSIRGSVSKNKVEPLLIIDGVPASGVSEMAQLNADDIETINFLKDASAAIYGAKAAGGVILVTTKRPDAGKTKVEYSGSVTRKIVGLQPRMMSMDEWTDGVLQARLNDGYGEDDNWVRYARLAKAMKGSWINLHGGNNPDEDPIPGGFRGVADFVFHDMNWTDVLWGNATSTQHNLSVSGGSEKSTYRLSLGYLNDQGTLQWGNNSNERYNVRLFNSFKINNRISLETNMSASRQHQVAPTPVSYTHLREQQYSGSTLRGYLHHLLDAGNVKYVLANGTGPVSNNFSRNFRHFLWMDNVIYMIDDLKTHKIGQFEWLWHTNGTYKKSGVDVNVTNGNSSVVIRPLYPRLLAKSDFVHDYPEDLYWEEIEAPTEDLKGTETYYSFHLPAEVNRIKGLTAIILKETPNEKDLPQMERREGQDWIGLRIRHKGKVTDLYINQLADGRLMHSNSWIMPDGWMTDAYMFAVSYPEGTEAKDATDFFICYGSALRRDKETYFSSLAKLFVIQKEEDKKLNLWIDGQPKIHASFRSKKKPIRVEVNNKRIPVVYKQSQLSIKLVD